MTLGCAFIFLVVVWLWRRRARKQRGKQTERFAERRGIDHVGWRWRLLRFGEKLFGHRASRRAQPSPLKPMVLQMAAAGEGRGATKTNKMSAAEEGRDMDAMLPLYDYPRPRAEVQHHHHHHLHVSAGQNHERHQSVDSASTLSAPSLYSQMTGVPRRVPQPREPLRGHGHLESEPPRSRFSDGTEIDEYYLTTAPYPRLPPPPAPPTSKSRNLNPFRR